MSEMISVTENIEKMTEDFRDVAAKYILGQHKSSKEMVVTLTNISCALTRLLGSIICATVDHEIERETYTELICRAIKQSVDEITNLETSETH